MPNASLTVAEWIRLFTRIAPPLPADLLRRPVNRVSRAALREVVKWMVGIGVRDG